MALFHEKDYYYYYFFFFFFFENKFRPLQLSQTSIPKFSFVLGLSPLLGIIFSFRSCAGTILFTFQDLHVERGQDHNV